MAVNANPPTQADWESWAERQKQAYLAVERERDQLQASLKREEVWSGGPDVEPTPTLVTWDGKTYTQDAFGDLHPFAPTDEQMRAAGWVKKARWVSEWEDVP